MHVDLCLEREADEGVRGRVVLVRTRLRVVVVHAVHRLPRAANHSSVVGKVFYRKEKQTYMT